MELNFSLKLAPSEKFSPLKEFVEKELLEVFELTPWYRCGLYLKILFLEPTSSAFEVSRKSLFLGEMTSFFMALSNLVE